jgi:hypothetical protein
MQRSPVHISNLVLDKSFEITCEFRKHIFYSSFSKVGRYEKLSNRIVPTFITATYIPSSQLCLDLFKLLRQ